MSRRAARHEEARLLLPWLVNGTLAEDERRAVEAHLDGCRDCRAELELCVALEREARAAEARAPAPHPVQLERLLARITAGAPEPEIAPAAPLDRAARWSPRARWSAAGMAAALLVAAALFVAPRPPGEPGFRTLSDPAASAPEGALLLRVVFEPDLPEARLRELTTAIGGEIVAGPTPLGVYTIAVRAGVGGEPAGWSLEHLRAQPGVRFVEKASGTSR
jgi:hypothetical protein